MPVAASAQRLVIILIRPSKYDDEGYVIRHLRGTLPSNTLSCLNSLTEDAIRQGALGDVDVTVDVIDEIVSKVDPRRLARKHRRQGVKILVGLVGVQTNQYPRAQDLARQFLADGCEVMIGGFHVSGAIAMSAAMPPECQEMIDAGVTLVLGEVENHWGEVLQDVVAGRRRPVYDFLDNRPELLNAPLPRASFKTQKKFMLKESGTIDAGRGCVFNCSFCTIINVQGRTMRARGAGPILEQIRQNYRLKGRRGIHHYFFTDDNFTRNPYWEAIFDGLIAMRESEGIHVDFMMQVDTQAPRVTGFIEKAARAGCVQVFIGMEAIRDDNLKAGGKPQNKSREYRDMIARWHAVGVVCHVGYIIGFPNDTYERVMEDVRTLRDTLLVDQASFFMLTPLPGSRDHQVAVKAGVPMDADYNNFDSFHATTPHQHMSAEEWYRAFRDAWREFYSFDHMRRSLLRQNPHTYWAVLKNFIWYRAAMAEGAHPMITGFFRLKDRRSRRPGFPIESRLTFLRRRVREHAYILREYAKIFLEMEELWLKTRIRSDQYAFLGDLRNVARRSTAEVKLNWGRIHGAMDARVGAIRSSVGSTVQHVGETMADRLDAVREAVGAWATTFGEAVNAHVPALPAPASSWRRRVAKLNVFSLRHLEAGRDHLREYWQQTWHAGTRLQFWRLNPVSVGVNFVRDARRTVLFFYAMMLERY
ncbi:MAG: radical SAM protein [Acidobacteria bacterium]|nr:radical SAM protein [Acidobacteriota bacterium]